ncbi:hypothetical protein [Sphingorhabdus wooponensis]|uniref:Uncharacterized protein n=1 Tax=Sphingorhabdus wooponensis TaxID=940136 RepID=A0A426RTF7_9SPHN|nr:hypothetical protein [Sphingorhabdus wooponensis]RRQ52285.1 hypothetical protein D7D48_05320 [Sphingorhabdus wooponensis]
MQLVKIIEAHELRYATVKILRFVFTASLIVLVPNSAFGQGFDPMVALKVRPPQIKMPDPILQMQRLEAMEASRARAERDRAEAERIRQQTDYMRRDNTPPYVPSAGAGDASATSSPSTLNQTIEKWLVAAQPRMHLFADFDNVIFASDVPFSERIIEMMSGSDYAADIAYYLAKHKAELIAIDKMSTLESAKAITSIELRLKSSK